ncbi:MAG: protein BatD [Candidatus Zixiibacteriota bacterium]|nr:MAG: protein BatD [candidate division Zixibacteria bacterium]
MKKIILTAMLTLGQLAAVAQDDITITMSLSRDTVGLMEPAMLIVTVSGPRQDLPPPTLPNLSMFEVYSQGTSTNISIVNGQVEASLKYQYLLQPIRTGTYNIKPAAVTMGRKRYESNEVILTVLEDGVATPKSVTDEAVDRGGKNKDVFLVAEVNKKNAYVNEQVTLSLKFYHSVRLYSQPEYTAPQTTDFWTDMLEPQKSYYETVNGKRYKVIEINTALFPTRSGELTIGRAMVEVQVPSQSRSRRDPFRSSIFDMLGRGESITVRSKPITITVRPLPNENKPSDFSGTVGDFTIKSSVDKRSVDVNQPVTVTYKISGTGNIKTIAEPDIGELDNFRVYRSSSSEKISKINEIIGGTKIFEEVYIPKRAGKLTIPGVSLNFFNPITRKYRTLQTKSIVLNVTAGDETEYAELPYRPVAGRVIDPAAKDIRYIKTDSGNLQKEGSLILFTPLYLILNGLPVLLLAATIVSRRRKEKLASDIGYARSRAAKKMARRRLGAAQKLAKADRPADFYAEIRQAMFSYVADKLNISPYGLTGDRLIGILQEAGTPEGVVANAEGILRRADFAQYAPAQVPASEIADSLQKAEELLVKLEETKFA